MRGSGSEGSNGLCKWLKEGNNLKLLHERVRTSVENFEILENSSLGSFSDPNDRTPSNILEACYKVRGLRQGHKLDV